MISIRRFEPRDIPDAIALWAATDGLGIGPGDGPPGVARLLERNPDLSWVAVDGEILAGTVLAAFDGRRGQIYHLAIGAAYRRQGLAKALMEKSLAGLRAIGVERCLLTVFSGNDDAEAFYRSLGWQPRPDLRVMLFDLD